MPKTPYSEEEVRASVARTMFWAMMAAYGLVVMGLGGIGYGLYLWWVGR